MAKVRELFTVWGFEVDMKPLERLDQAIETTKGALKSIAITAAAAGGTVFGLVKFTANAGDEALNMAQKVGVGVEALQELTFAAKLSDVSAEELQQSLTILSKKTAEAARGSGDSLRPFTQMGIRIRNSSGELKTADQLLTEMADKFKAMPDGIKKTSLATDLFGRSGANMLPFLNEGSAGIAKLRQEARELGIVFTEDQAKAADEFNDNMTRLLSAATGVRNMVGNELIPVFSDLLVEVKDMILSNKDLIAVNVKTFAQVLIQLFKNMVFILSQAVRVVRNFTEVLGGAANAAKFLAFAISLFLGLKLAFGVGQGVLAIIQITKAMLGMGNAALIAQAKLLLIPLAIAAIITAIALIAEDFITFSQGGNSVIGLIIKAIDEMFSSIGEKSQGLAIFLQGIFTVILTPVRAIVNAFGMIRDAIQVITGDKSLKDFAFSTFDRLKNTLGGSVFGGGIAADFGLSAPSLPVGSLPMPSPTQLAGRNVAVSQKADIKVDVTGLPPDVAESVAKSSMDDSFQKILRELGRESESAIER